MHIGMNMLSTAAIATMVEKRFGTLHYLLTVLWAIILTGIFYVSIAVAAQIILGNDDLMYSHALGFSGIMFHLLVLESNLTPHGTRSVFGFVTVPSYAYPAVMLVVMQFIMPNISFTGHLCGILSGTFHLYGGLDFVIPKDSFLQEMEQWRMLRSLTNKDNFVATPPTSSSTECRRDPSSLLRSTRRACQLACTLIGHVVETIQVAIFGRGRRANSNIYPGGHHWTSGWSSTATERSEDSDDTENDRPQQSQLV